MSDVESRVGIEKKVEMEASVALLRDIAATGMILVKGIADRVSAKESQSGWCPTGCQQQNQAGFLFSGGQPYGAVMGDFTGAADFWSGGMTEPASGGMTEPASAGITWEQLDLILGGMTEPASGGMTEPASGGMTEPASGGMTEPASAGTIATKKAIPEVERVMDKAQGRKDRTFEDRLSILEEAPHTMGVTMGTLVRHTLGTENRLPGRPTLLERVNVLEEMVDFLLDSLDETDDVAEDVGEKVDDIRRDLSLMANGLDGFLTEHMEQHEAIHGALKALGDEVFAREDEDDEGGVMILSGDNLEEIVDELVLDEVPEGMILRLSKSEYDDLSVDDVPEDAVEVVLAAQPDALVVLSVEFSSGFEDRSEIAEDIFDMLDDVGGTELYDADLIDTYRHLLTTGGIEYMMGATELSPPGFLAASLTTMSAADREEDGVYLVAIRDIEDLFEVCTTTYLINCARSEVNP